MYVRICTSFAPDASSPSLNFTLKNHTQIIKEKMESNLLHTRKKKKIENVKNDKKNNHKRKCHKTIKKILLKSSHT